MLTVCILIFSQTNDLLSQEKVEAVVEGGAAKAQLKELSLERDQLRGKVQDLNNKVDQLSQTIQEYKTTERLLEQRAQQLEVGRRRLEINILYDQGAKHRSIRVYLMMMMTSSFSDIFTRLVYFPRVKSRRWRKC